MNGSFLGKLLAAQVRRPGRATVQPTPLPTAPPAAWAVPGMPGRPFWSAPGQWTDAPAFADPLVDALVRRALAGRQPRTP